VKTSEILKIPLQKTNKNTTQKAGILDKLAISPQIGDFSNEKTPRTRLEWEGRSSPKTSFIHNFFHPQLLSSTTSFIHNFFHPQLRKMTPIQDRWTPSPVEEFHDTNHPVFGEEL